MGDRIFLDGDGVADVGHRGAFQEIGLDGHFFRAEVDVLADVERLRVVVVTHQHGGNLVFAGRDTFDLGQTVAVALGILKHFGLAVGRDRHRGVTDRFLRPLVDQFDFQIVILGLCTEGRPHEKQHE